MWETRTYHKDGSSPGPSEVFVFGSNLSGIHGAGAARHAYDWYGAQWGVGFGLMGGSFAIPTVQKNIAGPLPLEEIKKYVDQFLAHARNNRETDYFVTRIGCGLAGHEDKDVAPMFKEAPLNCSLPDPWKKYLD